MPDWLKSILFFAVYVAGIVGAQVLWGDVAMICWAAFGSGAGVWWVRKEFAREDEERGSDDL